MAILDFKKTHESGNIGKGVSRKYVVDYLVTCDTVRINALQIAFDRRCPKYGDRYLGVDQLAFVNEVNADRVKGSKFHWVVTVTYDSQVDVDADEENPLQRRPKTSIVAEFFQEEPIKDRNGLIFANAAGDPFQGVEVDNVRWKVRFKRNVPVDFPKYLLTCANKLNSAPVKLRGITFAKNTLRITGLEVGDEEKENDKWFSELSLEFTYDELLHRKFLLNQGFNEIHPLNKIRVNGKSVPIKQKILIRGEAPAEPQFLDKNGSRIHKKERVQGVDTIVYKDPPEPADIVVIERDPYWEFNYGDLPLK